MKGGDDYLVDRGLGDLIVLVSQLRLAYRRCPLGGDEIGTIDLRFQERRKENMKKIVCIFVAVLMIASVVYAQKKIAITAKDLPGMKGTWSGVLGFGAPVEGGGSAARLEILNDSAPVKAKLTVENMPDVLTTELGLQSGTNSFEADGVINSKGTILCTGPLGFFEITKSGDKKIMLTYWYRGLKGDGTFTKK